MSTIAPPIPPPAFPRRPQYRHPGERRPSPDKSPRPLKQVYPWNFKEKRMTIACGFVARDGILLCADTLYTDSFTKEYREKIFPWAGKGAAVCFAVAGDDAIARMAVEDCRIALSESPLRQLSIPNVIRISAS